MTRDEHRTKCIEAMSSALMGSVLTVDSMYIAFDALHGISKVIPGDWQCGDNYDCCAMDEMERADLTNPPEGKP